MWLTIITECKGSNSIKLTNNTVSEKNVLFSLINKVFNNLNSFCHKQSICRLLLYTPFIRKIHQTFIYERNIRIPSYTTVTSILLACAFTAAYWHIGSDMIICNIWYAEILYLSILVWPSLELRCYEYCHSYLLKTHKQRQAHQISRPNEIKETENYFEICKKIYENTTLNSSITQGIWYLY